MRWMIDPGRTREMVEHRLVRAAGVLHQRPVLRIMVPRHPSDSMPMPWGSRHPEVRRS